ncbi:MAG: tetratricopeptide repeat protein [Bacteroidales bacterium]|nr:tetratricopeptide repeat protein [Bacteroidales bacterium]
MNKILMFGIMLIVSSLGFSQTYIRDAELGDKDAQFRLGRMYHRADRMPKDITKAIYWYNLAAEQNQPSAIQALGELYYYGVETQRKPRLAYSYFERSAEFKNAEAYFILGEMNYNGIGTSQDKREAYSWYKKSADEGGLAKGQFKVGQMLFEGDGIRKDEAMGINYIKMAFQNGFPTALNYWTEKEMWKFEK